MRMSMRAWGCLWFCVSLLIGCNHTTQSKPSTASKSQAEPGTASKPGTASRSRTEPRRAASQGPASEPKPESEPAAASRSTPKAGGSDLGEELFWKIGIPKREHGYRNFKNTVIRTAKEYQTFRKGVAGQSGWNKRSVFLSALAKAQINFGRASLVLLSHKEGSGSIGVSLATPRLKKGVLFFKVDRRVPQVQTADMAYYAFAIVVRDSLIKTVVYTSRGKKHVLSVGAK